MSHLSLAAPWNSDLAAAAYLSLRKRESVRNWCSQGLRPSFPPDGRRQAHAVPGTYLESLSPGKSKSHAPREISTASSRLTRPDDCARVFWLLGIGSTHAGDNANQLEILTAFLYLDNDVAVLER